MRLDLSNRLKMYKAVNTYLSKLMSKVNSIAEFAISLVSFTAVFQNILDKEDERQSATNGKTDVKHSLRNELIAITAETAASLLTYARKAKNAEMKALAKVKSGKLERMKDVDLINKSQQIYKAANPIVEQLIPHGSNAEEIALLQEKITAFLASIGGREAAVATRVGAGATIEELFDEADEILEEELDIHVNKFEFKDPEFFEGYYSARTVKNYGVRHKPDEPEGTGEQSTGGQTETPAS